MAARTSKATTYHKRHLPDIKIHIITTITYVKVTLFDPHCRDNATILE